jgi:hypothetical protein
MGTARQTPVTCEVYEMVKSITSLPRCSWRALRVVSTTPRRRVTPAVKRRVLEYWAEHSGESPRGYRVDLPEGVRVIDMAGFWPGD